MPSFREKLRAKAEAVEAREAEAARLSALPPADLAALLMPAFGPEGPKANPSILNPGNRGGTNQDQLLGWLRRTYGVYTIRPKPWGLLETRVLEAVQVLEHAGLLYVHWISESNGRHWNATQAGAEALASGDVRQRIQDRTSAAPAPAAPPVITPPQVSTAQRLQELETLRAMGAITDTEYTAKREQIINEL